MNDEVLQRLLAPTVEPIGKLLLVHGPRGAGKSWWTDRAAHQARAAGWTVHSVNGRSLTPERLQSLLDHAMAPEACVVVDDVDHVSPGSRATLRATVSSAGGIAILSGQSWASFDGALAVRVRPLPDDEVVALLVSHGVGPQAARRCAAAAAGNPGLALSLADGLSDEQRADLAGVPGLPRLAAAAAAELHARLNELGEATCRALVVAAADDDGDLVAIGHTLRHLGESVADPASDGLESVFDVAEHAGVVDVVGPRVLFTDPWLRLAAYHLVAPASRRAAHRALAAAYDAPRQGDARVRHLVAAAAGPSDEVASALMVVAAATARRGDRAGAARMASHAADLSVDAGVRSTCLLRCIGWSLDVGDYAQAEHAAAGLDGTHPDERLAAAEVRALVNGDDSEVEGDRPIDGTTTERELATWSGRRAQRRQWWRDASAGRHGRVVSQVGSAAPPAELWARATALRHAGLVRDAVELAERALSVLPPHGSEMGDKWQLLVLDLAALTGRLPPGDPSVADGPRHLPEAMAVVARSMLVNDADLVRDPRSVYVPPEAPLADVRGTILRGLSNGDPAVLVEAAAQAEAASLPVEAGEAWLMAAELANDGEVTKYAGRATELLHRCAVRGWDERLRRLQSSVRHGASTPSAPADAALDGLSAAEWRVAEAVASGQTNREVASALFLSVKTVDFHLQQIYRKLAIRSRTELAVRVAGRAQGASR